MLGGDDIEDLPDHGTLGGGVAARGRGGRKRRPGNPLIPEFAGDADHLGTHRGGFTLGAGEDFGGGQFHPQRVTQFRGEEIGTQSALALRCRENDLREVRLEPREGGFGVSRGSPEPRQQGRHGRVVSSSLSGRDGFIGQFGDTRQLADGGLDMEPRHGAIPRPDKLALRRVEYGRYPLEAPGGRGKAPIAT